MVKRSWTRRRPAAPMAAARAGSERRGGDGFGHGGGVAHGDEEAGLVGDDDFGEGTAVGGDDGLAGGHAFDDDLAERLAEGAGVDDDVGLGEQGGDVFAEAEEGDAVFEGEVADQPGGGTVRIRVRRRGGHR